MCIYLTGSLGFVLPIVLNGNFILEKSIINKYFLCFEWVFDLKFLLIYYVT